MAPLLAVLTFCCMMPAPAAAQSVTLTPDQQRMLNQLPPSQRDAAMRQLRQFSQQAERSAMTRAQQDSLAEAPPEFDVPVEEPVVLPPRFEPRSTAIVSATLDVPTGRRGANEVERLEDLVARLREGNPYTLDADGRLRLPGIDPISLAGLTDEQASLRVSADPALAGIEVSLTLLPLTPVGLDAIEPFGYDLFESKSRLARTDYGVPVPADYLVGPGDTLRVILFGNRNAEYELTVERDGSVQFPEIGPLNVGGMTFAQLRELMRQQVNAQLIGTQVSVTMGELRQLQVFLVGDVNEPGSYTVSALSTITTVLSEGGGVARNGSLRSVQLKRSGRLVSTLDIYDLLLRGDTSGDIRVQAGDVVFVPPVGTRVTVAGEVKRPAIYEYRGAATARDAVGLAGGLLPSALVAEAKIERLDPQAGLLTLDARLTADDEPAVRLKDGDTLRIPAGIAAREASVSVVGNVRRPGAYEWRPGLRLTDLIPSTRLLEPGSDFNYVLIRREPEPNAGPEIVSADLAAAWQMRGGVVDLPLEPRDTLYVFDLDTGREQYIEPLIDELQLRSSHEAPLPVASIGGSVNAPGRFPIENGMRVADLVRAGGGLSQSAFAGDAELTRYTVGPDGSRRASVITVDLEAALSGDMSANVPVQAYDYLNIRETPNWRDQQFVEIVGEVAFPGRYPIRQGETLASIIDRAGGLSDLAFPQGSVFTRLSLQQREQEQIEILAERLESDLASLSLSDPSQSEALNIGAALLQQLRTAEPVGRLVIDLGQLLKGGEDADIIVRHGDTLYIPQASQEVTVLGEVQYGTSHVYEAGLNREDYIMKSGGITAKADQKRIYVVRANGGVIADSRSRFFARSANMQIQPGDTIVVPLDTDRVRPLTLWTSVSQIVYNIAIAATAVSRF